MSENSVIPKEEPKSNISISEQIKKIANQKIDSGFELKDNKSIVDLRKIISDELKIKTNSRTMVTDNIKEVLQDRGLKLSGVKFKNEQIEGIELSIEPPTAPLPPTSQSNIPSNNPTNQNQPLQNPHGTLPMAESKVEKTELTPAQMKSQERFFKKVFSLGADLMVSLGVVETDDEEELKQIEKPKPIKKFREDMDDLAKEGSELMAQYGMALPKYLDLIAFGISAVSVIVMPIVLKFAMTDKEPQEKKFEKLDVEVKI